MAVDKTFSQCYKQPVSPLNVLSAGIDLAGSPLRNTGFCVMDERMRCRTAVLHTDKEIVDAVLEAMPSVVSIDAPLFLPKGRESLEKKGPPHLRVCDRELMRMKIRFFPISLGPMRSLTERGIRLRVVLERKGFRVIESFPGAIQDILGIPRKQSGLKNLQAALIKYGLVLPRKRGGLTGDELDAATSALVGLMYLRGDYKAIGDPDEGLMILPSTKG